METYTQLLRLAGPWNVYRHEPPRLHDTVLHGESTEYTMLGAETNVGGIGFELLQPLEGPSISAEESLEERGEGLHHLAIMAHDFGESTELKNGFAETGSDVLMGGRSRRDDRVLLPRHRPVPKGHPRIGLWACDRPGARLHLSLSP